MVLFGLTLSDKLCIEFLVGVFGFAILCAVLWSILQRIVNGRKGVAREATARRLTCVWTVAVIVLALCFFVVLPILIMVLCRDDIAALEKPVLRVLSYVVIAFPIPIALATIIYSRVCARRKNDIRYCGGKHSREANPEEFKTVADFRDELVKRGLYFDDEAKELLAQLNSRFPGDKTGERAKYYYSEATIMPLTRQVFEDSPELNEIISPDTVEKYPGYIYNAILILTDEGSKMRYAPIARYSMHKVPEGEEASGQGSYPYNTDCYVECKVLYIDGEISVVLGVGESKACEKREGSVSSLYYVVFSQMNFTREERDFITTYVDGRYYLLGTLRYRENGFTMETDNVEREFIFPGMTKNYPITLVGKLDREKINEVAEASVRGYYLKDAVEKHFAK